MENFEISGTRNQVREICDRLRFEDFSFEKKNFLKNLSLK